MITRGELKVSIYNFAEKETILQFAVQGNVAEEAKKLIGKFLDVKFFTHSEKRSLNANALYWQIVGQIARATETSNSRIHNYLLRRYGVLEEMDGQYVYVVIPDDNEEQVLESESYHLKPTSQVKEGKDGKTYRTYMLLRGSSAYDTKEMARLIDGAISEARDMGLEVDTYDYDRWLQAQSVNPAN